MPEQFTQSGKDRRRIRALLHGERAVVQVGKAGLNDALIESADDVLEAREAIKIAILRGCPLEVEDAVAQLADALGAEVIQQTGRTALLFRPNPEESDE